MAGNADRVYFSTPLLLFALNQEVQLRYPNAMLEWAMTLLLLLVTYLFLLPRARAPLLATLLTGVGAFHRKR